MPIEVKCNCGAEYRLDDSRAGQEFTCKVCSTQMELPVGSPRAVPPPQMHGVPPILLRQGSAARGTAAARSSASSAGQSRQTPGDEAPAVVTGPEGVEEHVTRWPQAWAPPQADPPLPIQWMIIRGIIWAACATFLLVPWYNKPHGIGTSGPVTVTPTAGYMVISDSIHAIVSGIANPRFGLAHTVKEMIGLDSVPTESSALAGAALMVFSPAVYAGSLILALVVAITAVKRGGRGLALPFVLYWLSLLGFLAGWLMVSRVVPVWRAGPEAATVGVSIWVYTMLLALVPMTLLVRTRPEMPLEPAPVLNRRGAEQPA